MTIATDSVACAIAILPWRHAPPGVGMPAHQYAVIHPGVEPAADIVRRKIREHPDAFDWWCGRGFVIDSFWSAWDAFALSGSYRETILRAVGYGNDTDTTAAIAGSLAGLYRGTDEGSGGIRSQWRGGLRGSDLTDGSGVGRITTKKRQGDGEPIAGMAHATP